MSIKVTKENFLSLDRATQQKYTVSKLAEGYGSYFTQMHDDLQKSESEKVVFDLENLVRYPELDTFKELTSSLKSHIGNYKLAKVTASNIIADLKL